MIAAGVALAAGSAVLAASTTLTGVVPRDCPAGTPIPLAAPLPEDWPPGPLRAAIAVAGGSTATAAAQFEPGDPRRTIPPRAWLLWSVSEADRGQPLEVTFAPADVPPPPPPCKTRCADAEAAIRTAGGAEILRYWHGPPNTGIIPPLTDYLHPLFGLDGEVLTDLRPRDHLHHRGVFWAWVRHERDGRSLGDWWHPMQMQLEPGSLACEDGPVFTRLAATHRWVSLAAADGTPERFIEETAVLRVFPATPNQGDSPHLRDAHSVRVTEMGTVPEGRAIDLDLTLTALEDGVRIGGTLELKKGYGGLTIRFAPAKEPQMVADGKPQPKDANHLRAHWVDWSGLFARPPASGPARPVEPPARSGVAILVHPSHPDSPPEWIARLYGVIGPAYPGLEMLALPKGKPLQLNYRLWVHRGGAAEGGIEAVYRVYAADWKWTRSRGRG